MEMDEIKDEVMTPIDQSSSYMPARLKDEVEKPEDGVSDVLTPAVRELFVADWLRTPDAWERLSGNSDTQASMMADQLFSSESFRLAAAMVTLSGCEEVTSRALFRCIDAFLEMGELVREHPECAERIERVAGQLLSGSYEVVKHLTLVEHARQNGTMRPLAKENSAKAAAKKRAQVIATERWQADTAKKIKIGVMAEHVWAQMIEEGFRKSLPDKSKTLQDWIRSAAPPEARKAGRPPKAPGR